MNAVPIKSRAGIGLATGRDVAVADDLRDGIAVPERAQQSHQHAILRRSVGDIITAFELNAD